MNALAGQHNVMNGALMDVIRFPQVLLEAHDRFATID